MLGEALFRPFSSVRKDDETMRKVLVTANEMARACLQGCIEYVKLDAIVAAAWR